MPEKNGASAAASGCPLSCLPPDCCCHPTARPPLLRGPMYIYDVMCVYTDTNRERERERARARASERTSLYVEREREYARARGGESERERKRVRE
jgi:hypothetical protein